MAATIAELRAEIEALKGGLKAGGAKPRKPSAAKKR
jgi:hypothetical protein